MTQSDTDRQWERFGKIDPYFGVVTDPRYHKENLTATHRKQFFASGAAHVQGVFNAITRYVYPACSPTRALDFGCGVARLVIPLAHRASEVVGVDVSSSMLREAEANCRAEDLTNVTLVRSDDSLEALTGTFDLIHSYIVFQHIPVQRGTAIFSKLLDRLRPGGVGAIHFTYSVPGQNARTVNWLKERVPFRDTLGNLIRREPLGTPVFRMYPYDLTRLLHRVQALGVTDLHLEFSDHSGALGVMLYFRRPG